MKIRWLLHEALFNARIDDMVEIVRRRDDEAIVLSGRSPSLPEPTGTPTIGLVTLQIARKIYAEKRFNPGVFWSPANFDQVHWSSFFGKWMLNDDILWLPWAEFVRRGSQGCAYHAVQGQIFIRPSSGFKVFPGQTISLTRFTEDTRALDATSGVMPDTLIGFCRPKPIDNDLEWRFWLGRGGIVTHSAYSWQDDVALAAPPEAVHDLAGEIAIYCANEINWTPDRLFVADFCMSGGEPKLVELNSASCSGVYNANLEVLVDGFREAILAEIEAD